VLVVHLIPSVASSRAIQQAFGGIENVSHSQESLLLGLATAAVLASTPVFVEVMKLKANLKSLSEVPPADSTGTVSAEVSRLPLQRPVDGDG
jgi:hypothetical protein